MTIKDVEERTGLPRASVRYYESEGLISPSRGENGYRDYSEADVETLLKVKLLRELECSLEDIRALQAGETALDTVLWGRLAALEGDQARLDRARVICQRLRSDGAEYATLEPERYLRELPPEPPQPEIPDPRFSCPWRRCFARSLDFLLCSLLWYFLQGLVLRKSILHMDTGGNILATAAALALMLLLEPLFLHFFRTTPGKWVFGLGLTRSDGSPLGYGEALRRTGRVLVFGLGLRIPIAGFITTAYAWHRNRNRREQLWEQWDEAYEDRASGQFWDSALRFRAVPLFLGAYVAVFFALAGLEFHVAQPPHREVRSSDQFVENYNHILRYLNAPQEPYRTLLPDGTWALYNDGQENVLTLELTEGYPPLFQFETGKDGLTAVFFSYEYASSESFLLRVPGEEMALALQALSGHGVFYASAQNPLAQAVERLRNPQEGSRGECWADWSANYTLTAEGGELHSLYGTTAVMAREQGTPVSLRLNFRAERDAD